MRRSRVAFALGVVVPLLLVGGCSGEDPEPRFTPTESSSPTDSDSPSSVDDSDSSSPENEQASFIDAYFREFSDAIPTGKPETFLDMSSDKCQSCAILARNLSDAYANGGHVEGGHWTVASSHFVRRGHVGSIWNVNVSTAREHWFDGDGREVKIVRPSVQRLAVALVKDGDSWRVREMRLR